MGLLERAAERLKALTADDDGRDDLEQECIESTATPIAQSPDRERVTIQGRVRGLTLPSTGAPNSLAVDLIDPSGSVRLIFVGRKAIPGIDCGVTLRAAGRISGKGSNRVMYNPAYEIVPKREH